MMERPMLYVKARVTVQCPDHGSHSVTAVGPMTEVLRAVKGFRDIAEEFQRWVLTEYQALDEPCQLEVYEWD